VAASGGAERDDAGTSHWQRACALTAQITPRERHCGVTFRGQNRQRDEDNYNQGLCCRCPLSAELLVSPRLAVTSINQIGSGLGMVSNPRLPGEASMSIRPVKRLVKSKPTREGAGVHLRRAFGFGNTSDFDPFLLLDDFRNDVPEDYLAGFPWHPHRGIETITYVLAGTVEHKDSLGNHGAIAPGDVQWMTAGRGIIHQEMPKGDDVGRMHGFQLWANLPASQKMTPPRYQEVNSPDIPEVTDDDGTSVRIVCGTFWGKKGPVDGIATDPIYIDVTVPPGKRKVLAVETTRHAFAYVFAGAGKFCNASEPLSVPTESVGWLDTKPPAEADNRSLVLFDRGDEVMVQAGDDGLRFLLVSGKPLEEPVAWYGPIVMNSQAELRQAFDELDRGTFLKAEK
jgi:redox-sensitive bicupin YhaK (pirin superfamily)